MNKEKALLNGLIILVIASIIGTGIYHSSNSRLKKSLNEEKLKTELMLSEKLALEKEVESFKNQLNALSGKNAEMDSLLAETRQKLSEKESQINKIIRENGNVKALKKQLADLTQMKNDFESQVAVLNNTILRLNEEKNSLNNKVFSLEDENKKLTENIRVLNTLRADNYLVETKKRNDRITIVARRAKKMSMTFNVPENLVENISFKLIKPDGTQLDGKGNGIAYRVVNEDEGLTASLSSSGELKVSKKIEMTWEPKKKQKPGIYKIELYNSEKYIGACSVNLR